VVGQKQRGMVSDSDRDRAWPSVAEGTWAITHSTSEDAGRFGASFCQALFVRDCAGAVLLQPRRRQMAITTTIPYLGEQSMCTSFFQMLCFLLLDTNGERRLNCASVFNPMTTCFSGSGYHASSHNHNSRTQLRNTWVDGYRTRLQRLPSPMTCRCCPICALQMHSHRHGICVQHPCLGGFGLSALPPRQPSSASK
jgi:hypothetical protein